MTSKQLPITQEQWAVLLDRDEGESYSFLEGRMLIDEVERQKKVIDGYRTAMDYLTENWEEGAKKQQAEVEQLHSIIKVYAFHTATCDNFHDAECNCGWNEVKKDLFAIDPKTI